MPDDINHDFVLMQRVAAGDQPACRIVIQLYLKGMIGLSFRMLRDMAATEDIAQDAFLRLWRIAKKWKPEARISKWLYRVTHNLATDEIRCRGKFIDQEVPDIRDKAADQYNNQHTSEVAAQVKAAIARLPVRQRAAINLVHHQGLTNIEVAEVMDISNDALESLLSRGRRKLKELLIDRKNGLVGGV
jgi:RNA polymerase sigma-70 factor (ECF subfamily)